VDYAAFCVKITQFRFVYANVNDGADIAEFIIRLLCTAAAMPYQVWQCPWTDCYMY